MLYSNRWLTPQQAAGKALAPGFKRIFMSIPRPCIDDRSATARFLLLLLIMGMTACATTGNVSLSGDPLVDRWGVKVLQIRLSAEGYMLDFRYRVLDPGKAEPLFDRNKQPYLIDQATGAKFLVPESPKVGAMRSTRPPKQDKNYFILFANPGRYVKQGNKVTVVIGDFRAENLIVE
jgi:hypothetical protein